MGCDYFEGLKGYGIQRFLKDVWEDGDYPVSEGSLETSIEKITQNLKKYKKIVDKTDISFEDYLSHYKNISQEFLILNPANCENLDWYKKIRNWTRQENILNFEIKIEEAIEMCKIFWKLRLGWLLTQYSHSICTVYYS